MEIPLMKIKKYTAIFRALNFRVLSHLAYVIGYRLVVSKLGIRLG